MYCVYTIFSTRCVIRYSEADANRNRYLIHIQPKKMRKLQWHCLINRSMLQGLKSTRLLVESNLRLKV